MRRYKTSIIILVIFIIISITQAVSVTLFPAVINEKGLSGNMSGKWTSADLQKLNKELINEMSLANRFSFISLSNNVLSIRAAKNFITELTYEEKQYMGDYFLFITIDSFDTITDVIDPSAAHITLTGTHYLINKTNTNDISSNVIKGSARIQMDAFNYKEEMLNGISESLADFSIEIMNYYNSPLEMFLLHSSVSHLTKRSINVNIGSNIGGELGQYYDIYSEENRLVGRAVVQRIYADSMQLALADSARGLSTNATVHEHSEKVNRISLSVGYIVSPFFLGYPEMLFCTDGGIVKCSFYIGYRNMLNIMSYMAISKNYDDYVYGYKGDFDIYIESSMLNFAYIGVGYSYEIYFQRTRCYLYPELYFGIDLFQGLVLSPGITLRFRIFNWLSLDLQYLYGISTGVVKGEDDNTDAMVTLSLRFFDSLPYRPLLLVQ